MKRSLNLLFLNPKLFFNTWPLPTDLSRFTLGFPSVTFPQLASTILPDDRYDIFDGAFERCGRKPYLEILRHRDVVAISFHSAKIALNTAITIRLIRALSPAAKIVIGGHHATAFHRLWIRMGADAVVRGEGEQTFPHYLESIRHESEPTDVPGLTYRWNGRVHENPDREFVEDLDRLPFPAWDRVKLENYHLRISRQGLTGSVETARGCPHSCSFCSASSMWRHHQRLKSADRVLEEMERLHRLGVRQFAMVDDNFGLNADRDSVIMEGIMDRLPGISWWAFMRADTPLKHPDLIALASRSGLRQAIVGYESFSEDRLKRMKKGYRGFGGAVDYGRSYEIFRRHGIFIIGEFIVGLPGETDAERKMIIRQAPTVCDCVTFNPLDYIHGTRDGADFLASRQLSEEVLFYNIRGFSESPNDQERLIASAYVRYFLNPRTWSRMFSRNEVTSDYMKNLYWTVVSNTAKFSPTKLRNFLLSRRTDPDITEKKKRIEARHLGRPYLERLIRGSGVRLPVELPEMEVSAYNRAGMELLDGSEGPVSRTASHASEKESRLLEKERA